MTGVSLVIILVIVIVACLATEGRKLWTQTWNVDISRMISTLGPLQSSYWGSSNSKLSAHSGERHPPPPPQYSACYCLSHWHPKMFPLCSCEGNRTTSGKMIEQVGGPLEATSASSYCPKQFSSGSNLHVPFNCTTCQWFTGPPSLDRVLRNICCDANTC